MAVEQQDIDDFITTAAALILAAVDYAGSTVADEIGSSNIRKLRTACGGLIAALDQANATRIGMPREPVGMAHKPT